MTGPYFRLFASSPAPVLRESDMRPGKRTMPRPFLQTREHGVVHRTLAFKMSGLGR